MNFGVIGDRNGRVFVVFGVRENFDPRRMEIDLDMITAKRPRRQLLREKRRHSVKCRGECLFQFALCPRIHRIIEGLKRVMSERVGAILLNGRGDIGQARLRLSETIDLVGDSACGVEDQAVPVDQNKVAVLAHHFRNKAECGFIAVLIEGVDFDFENAVKPDLPHVVDASANEILAKVLAESKRRRRVGGLALCEVNAGKACVVAEAQNLVLPRSADHEVDVGIIGLANFLQMSILKPVSQFRDNRPQRQAVIRNFYGLLCHNYRDYDTLSRKQQKLFCRVCPVIGAN